MIYEQMLVTLDFVSPSSATTFNYRSNWPDRVGGTAVEIRLMYFRTETQGSNLVYLTDPIIL